MSNPDLVALGYLEDTLSAFSVTYPDGATGYFDQIDVGYQSKPTTYPYVSLHTIGSRAPIRHLGQGAGTRARSFEIDAAITIEYEDPEAKRGFERLTQLRWDVFLHLVEHAQSIPGVEYADMEEATVQTFNADDGGFEEWGFFGQIIIPITITLTGAALQT